MNYYQTAAVNHLQQPEAPFKIGFGLNIKLILKDGHTFPETATIIFFSEKFVF